MKHSSTLATKSPYFPCPSTARITHQIRLPQPLARSKQLITRRAGHNKVLCRTNAPNTIKAANKWLPSRMVDARNHGADKVRPEALLVQTRRHQIRHRLRGDLPFLAQAVHVDFEAEEVADGVDVGGEAGEPEVDVAVGEDLGEVVGDGQGLQAEAEVAGDGHAVFADHGDAGSAIWRVLGGRCEEMVSVGARYVLMLKGELWRRC